MGNVIEIKTKQLRSVQALFHMIKQDDPDSAATEFLIRQLVYSGSVPTVQSGNKRLACFEDLAAYLYEGKRWNNREG